MNNRWELKGEGIVWKVSEDSRLPHIDKMEISGAKSSVLVEYGVEEDRSLSLSQRVVFPLFRKTPNNTHASLTQGFHEEMKLPVLVNGEAVKNECVETIEFDGILTIHSSAEDLVITRKVFPASSAAEAYQEIVLQNKGSEKISVQTTGDYEEKFHKGATGVYATGAALAEEKNVVLEPGQECQIFVRYYARNLWEKLESIDNDSCAKEREARIEFCKEINEKLVLKTPDEYINREFAFTKIRAAESIFETSVGKLHSPGGGHYYAAIWTNDQAEYAGPFFSLLGYEDAMEASMNCYRLFRNFMSPDYTSIPSSLIPEANDLWEGAGDRGDAAMYLFGICRFLLLYGNKEWIQEMWPAVKWCVEYCRRKTGEEGVIYSDSDELEGRLESGEANLCTSSNAYGGYRMAAIIAEGLGENEYAKELLERAEALKAAIESYFGKNVQGFDTYQYYKGNDLLRSWICMPITVGILERRDETLRALFSEYLWTEDGMKSVSGNEIFWDRSTLYGLKGGFQAGAEEKMIPYLQNYTKRRLVGEHVPYPVEAYPEGDQRHLSAESALYGRVIVDGMFGIEPASMNSIFCRPAFPNEWNEVSLENIAHSGSSYSLFYKKEENIRKMTYKNLTTGEEKTYEFQNGEKIEIALS